VAAGSGARAAFPDRHPIAAATRGAVVPVASEVV
jgi:hypothetical protein